MEPGKAPSCNHLLQDAQKAGASYQACMGAHQEVYRAVALVGFTLDPQAMLPGPTERSLSAEGLGTAAGTAPLGLWSGTVPALRPQPFPVLPLHPRGSELRRERRE